MNTKEQVMKRFEELTGLKAKVAWPIDTRAWQVEAEDGQVYTLHW